MAAAPEVAPLVDGADGEAEPEEDPLKWAEREVAEADGLLRRWAEGRRDTAPFDLTVKPMIGGAEAAVTLAGVTSQMSVSELHDRVHAEMASHPTPDEQRLFIVDRGKGPLRDETLPVGAYGVVAGATLHLALRDGDAAAARRVARVQVRAAQAKARAAQAKARAARARQLAITGAPRNPCDRIMGQIMFLAVVVGCLLLPVALMYSIA